MTIGPRAPLLKNDGPACRVCGCTEHNACVTMQKIELTPAQKRDRWSPMATIACSWVKVEGATLPLCSACSGTAADMQEALGRGCRMLQQHSDKGIAFALVIGNAARARYRARLKKGD